MCSVGWNRADSTDAPDASFPSSRLSAARPKLREAIACAHGLGYQIVCHVCNTIFYTVSDRYDEYNSPSDPTARSTSTVSWREAGRTTHVFSRLTTSISMMTTRAWRTWASRVPTISM
jgi:hypothetical protein